MTISELAERAEVTPRTIRYYVEQGLLPPPGRGRVAEYTDEHLELLSLIARLKRQYLPLDEIRNTLQRLGREELQELLVEEEDQRPMPRLSSAADYVAGVLERGRMREQSKLQEPHASPAYSLAPPMPAPSAPSAPPSLPTSKRHLYSPIREGQPLQSAFTQEDPQLEVSDWQRVTVAPGVELHFDASARARVRGVLSRLIRVVGDILESSPEKDSEEN